MEQPAAAASGDPSNELEDSPAKASESRRRVNDADGQPGTKRRAENPVSSSLEYSSIDSKSKSYFGFN